MAWHGELEDVHGDGAHLARDFSSARGRPSAGDADRGPVEARSLEIRGGDQSPVGEINLTHKLTGELP